MNKFAERFNEILKQRNISQREFAKQIKMSSSIINNYCTGVREPSLDSLMLVCKALEESSDYLLGITDN